MDDKRNILFETKEDSIQQRRKEVLEGDPHERFVFFYDFATRCCFSIAIYPISTD